MADLKLDQVQERLNSMFVTYGERKLIFWYDPQKEFEEDIDNGQIKLDNAQIKKIKASEQFLTKRFFELKDTENNYLIYAPYNRLSDDDPNNHLLSMMKYSEFFTADRISLIMSELGIAADLHEVMEKYHSFFTAKKRISSFEALIVQENASGKDIIITMMAVLVKANTAQFYNVISALFEDYAAGNDSLFSQLEKFGLADAFWNYIFKIYGYQSNEPTIQKLLICFYVNTFYAQIGEQNFPGSLREYEVRGQINAIVSLMDLFIHDSRYTDIFDQLSNEVYRLINGDKILNKLSPEKLVLSDVFKEIDDRIIDYYNDQLLYDDVTPVLNRQNIEEVITFRIRMHFGLHFKAQYYLLLNAQKLLNNDFQLTVTDFAKIVKDYEDVSYKNDSFYRKFIWNFDQIKNQEGFLSLKEKIEKSYTLFLDKSSRLWNDHLSLSERPSMLNFYDQFAHKKAKTVVIISDALRYEVAKEIQNKIQKEKKYSTEMSTIFTVLPSVTEFGKAASLRSGKETFDYIDGTDVRVAGKSTAGTDNRNKILAGKTSKAKAFRFDDLVATRNVMEFREFFRDLDVIYIYHDQIDKTGDHGQEKQVFDAVEKTIEEIPSLITRIANGANISRFIITSDHGFIYKRNTIEEFNKIDNPSEDKEDRVERRFIISKKHYKNIIGVKSLQLGKIFQNDDERYIHYPETSTIFKKAGGGQNYVHGGSSPQEMIVPVLQISVAKGSAAKEPASVQLTTSKRKIVGLSIALEFYQTEPVSDNVVKSRYQLYFEDSKGNRISNEQSYFADSTATSAGDRFTNFTFELINRKYDLTEKIYFVIKNAQTQVELTREEFVVDNPFAGNFGFDF